MGHDLTTTMVQPDSQGRPLEPTSPERGSSFSLGKARGIRRAHPAAACTNTRRDDRERPGHQEKAKKARPQLWQLPLEVGSCKTKRQQV